LQITGKAAT